MARQTIALIGAGRMGTALATGWINGRKKPEIILVDPNPSDLVGAMAEEEGLSLNPDPGHVDVVVIAVKPQVFADVSSEIKAWIGPKTLVLSIMAGIRLKDLASALGTKKILRAMPNTPGSVGQGVTILTAPEDISKANITAAINLLKPLGVVVGPVHETQISAMTGISGCGPAYVFLMVEALAAAGEAEGIAPDTALMLARETLIGAAALLEDESDHPEDLRKAVTSKGGVTQAALDVLMRGDGLPSLMREAVRAAASRERALSSGK